MATPDRMTRLEEGDYSGAAAAWGLEFGGREDTLEATWELAGIEERWGDSLFFDGEPGAAAHYRAAQRALVPQGAAFTSSEESERRMEAFGRLTNKLYAVGPDGRARPIHDAKAHPGFRPAKRPKAAAPARGERRKEERRTDVRRARQARTLKETEFSQVLRGCGHWGCHDLGNMWFEAAGAMAPVYPVEARQACAWSLHYFELYNEEWSAHLPASRWDSDGNAEMTEVIGLRDSLDIARQESPPPDWAALLLEGDWRGALRTFGSGAPSPALKPLVVLLIHVCTVAGRPDEVRDLVAKAGPLA